MPMHSAILGIADTDRSGSRIAVAQARINVRTPAHSRTRRAVEAERRTGL
jgi:hypothetical protein